MHIRHDSITAALLLAMAVTFAIPDPVEARGSSRRNYADEMRRDEQEEERREERERSRREWQEHQEEQQKRYLEHKERQLDTVIDHSERVWGVSDGAPAAPASSGPKGTCIYGADDKVVYQPKGVVCNH